MDDETTYWRGPYGAFYTTAPGVAPAPGSVEITREEYDDGVAAVLAAQNAEEHAAVEAELALRRRVYEDLKDNAGFSDETSRFLSGYYSEEED